MGQAALDGFFHRAPGPAGPGGRCGAAGRQWGGPPASGRPGSGRAGRSVSSTPPAFRSASMMTTPLGRCSRLRLTCPSAVRLAARPARCRLVRCGVLTRVARSPALAAGAGAGGRTRRWRQTAPQRRGQPGRTALAAPVSGCRLTAVGVMHRCSCQGVPGKGLYFVLPQRRGRRHIRAGSHARSGHHRCPCGLPPAFPRGAGAGACCRVAFNSRRSSSLSGCSRR